MKAALVASIGTTHPWNIAGVGLDARVAVDYGLGHVAAIAAVSAQDARGLHALQAISPDIFRAQLASLPDGVCAYRIGALVSSENVRTAARFLRENGQVPLVIDPVFAVTLGGELRSDDELPCVFARELLALGAIVTPNLSEAAALTHLPVRSVDDMRIAGRRLLDLGARAAYVKGGHLHGEPTDVLVAPGVERAYTSARIAGSMRGTGCTLAAALVCELALGRGLESAAESAHAYVRARIAAHAVRGGLQVAF